MEQPVMGDHADEGAGSQEGIDRPKRAIFNSCANVCGEMVIEDFVVLAEEHLGQFVPFQRAEQEESQECRVDPGANAIARDQCKHAMVVALSVRFVGKYLKTKASLTPAALAISLVVVPLNPFAAKSEAAAAMRLA
jgi:hypothetical protein